MLSLILIFTGTLSAADLYGKADPDPYGKDGLTFDMGTAWDSKALEIGDPITVGGVTVYPVIDEEAPKDFTSQTVSLSDAMMTGQLSVLEASGAHVSAVQMVNTGKSPVYVMAGEVIRGGRQDRMITDDVIVPPHEQPLMVQVHCVEKDRWSEAAGTFSYGGRAEYALWSALENGADQESTWSVVAALNANRGASATGAYVSLGGPEWVTYRHQLRSALSDADQVVGAVVAHNGTLVHAEMFGDPNLAAISRAVALDGYARDAVAMGSTTDSLPDEEVVEAFLFSHLEVTDTVADF
jgi:hypothetical protein